ncbi:MAG: putative inorganic carbon transporter subunit DabA [Methylococcales bacterium]
MGPESPTNQRAHEHVLERAASIFEPRPEYNHSNNLYCVVGRRTLTRELFMDRRAFLHSYLAETDPEGNIIIGILSAIFPVCGGINLEYFFSRIDNSVYGSGAKLPHNVIGLLGVANWCRRRFTDRPALPNGRSARTRTLAGRGRTKPRSSG